MQTLGMKPQASFSCSESVPHPSGGEEHPRTGRAAPPRKKGAQGCFQKRCWHKEQVLGHTISCEARKNSCPILSPCLGQRGWCSCCWPRHGQGVRRVPRLARASRVQGDLQSTEWAHALLAPWMEASWAPLHLPRPADLWEGEHGSPHPNDSSLAGRGQCPCSHPCPSSHNDASGRDTLLQAGRFHFWLPAPLGEQAEAPA